VGGLHSPTPCSHLGNAFQAQGGVKTKRVSGFATISDATADEVYNRLRLSNETVEKNKAKA
jgi:hypothetical protein